MKNLFCLFFFFTGIFAFSGDLSTPLKFEVSKPLTLQASDSSDLLWYIDYPQPNATVSGIAIIQGWVLSNVPISAIHLYINDVFVTSANIDIPRDDVIEHYPQYATSQNPHPGFTVGFNSRDYENGRHYFHLVVVDSQGASYQIGRRYFYVDNTLNPGPKGYLESPKPDDFVSGPYPVFGWVLDEDGVERVEVLIDGMVVGRANLNGPRPDVYYAFSYFPNAARSGFVMFLDSTRIYNGPHQLSVLAYDNLAQSNVIGIRNITVSNQPLNAPPFGKIDWPLRDVELVGQCSSGCSGPSGDPSCLHPLNFITGWVLDTGSRSDLGAVSWVELLLDGQPFFNTKTDCYYDYDLDSWVNCYGVTRFDVQEYYPGFTNVPQAGFKFWLDIGNLILNYGYTEGLHYLGIRAGDVEDTHAIIDEFPVVFRCVYGSGSSAYLRPAGYIDIPQAYQYLYGTVRFMGWAIDYNKIAAIRVWIDGVYWGNAVYGDERPDVYNNFERSSSGLYSGWHFDVDTTLLSNSEHDVVIEVVDTAGDARILGERRFVVFNNITEP
ncbi:MAG: hypothetical protein WHV67_06725 [Thermoanaerobaculia bacterium]